jgi:hypothetical protein
LEGFFVSDLLLMLPVLLVFSLLYGAYLALFKAGRRLRGLKIAFGSVALFPIVLIVFGVFSENVEAQEAGYLGKADLERAEAAGYLEKGAEAWAVERARLDQAVRDAEAIEREREEALRLAVLKEEEAAKAAAEIERRDAGFHCLSEWDGSHDAFKKAVKKAMREPDSFEHIETLITPVNAEGYHTVQMEYRARNGFGGMNVSAALAKVRNSDCGATILSYQ